MNFSFHARSFKSKKAAVKAFYAINARMEENIPNAFLTVTELDAKGGYAVLLGCDDDDAGFVDLIEPVWAHAKPVNVHMEVWMSLEANHCMRIAEHASEESGEDFIHKTENIIINPDGTSDEGL